MYISDKFSEYVYKGYFTYYRLACTQSNLYLHSHTCSDTPSYTPIPAPPPSSLPAVTPIGPDTGNRGFLLP